MATINQIIRDDELADLKLRRRDDEDVVRLCEALEAERVEHAESLKKADEEVELPRRIENALDDIIGAIANVDGRVEELRSDLKVKIAELRKLQRI